MDSCKVTYIDGENRQNFYVRCQCTFDLSDIQHYILNAKVISEKNLRYYWIDTDGDEINLANNNDWQCFLGLHPPLKKHLFVTPLNAKKAEPSPISGFVHKRIQCDGCGKSEIVGFRYKCLQCGNYDLCENCEKKHVHSEHLMLRMPDDTFRHGLSSFIRGFSGFGAGNGCPFSHSQTKKNAGTQSKRGGCPFVKVEIGRPNSPRNNGTTTRSTSDAPPAAATTSADEPTCKKNKQGVQAASNGFSKLFTMLNDMAEGTATSAAQTEATVAATVTEASKIAEQAAQVAQQAANQAVSSILLNVHNMTAQNAPTTSAETAADTTANVSTTTPNEANNNNNNNNNENSASTSNANVSGLESLTQYLEPQFMKQGIQILNNFSDLFAKMLDSMETAGSSAASVSSSFAANVADASTATSTNSGESSAQQPQEEERILSVAEECIDTTERRSPSIEGDWQILDNQQQQQPSTAAPDLIEVNPPASKTLNYTQLSEDLHAHLNLEERNVDNTSDNNNQNNNNNNNNNNNAADVDNGERRFVPVYHPDERINNSVLAMMAMGFSNEGSWLTQLVDSVDGNISEALDLMNVAQRGNQRK